jgi:hypothetical protein
MAPIATLQLYHQTAHCLGVVRESHPEPPPARTGRRVPSQMELPLQVA